MSQKSLRRSKSLVLATLIIGALPLVASIVIVFNLPVATQAVVGTPIIGADVAVAGKVHETTSAHNVTVVVDDVKAYSPGYISGYTFVIVNAKISNDSCYLITTDNIRLVDDFSNAYADWGTLAANFQLARLPDVISRGQAGMGALVFQVPEPALNNKLRLTVELKPNVCTTLSTRLVIFFDDVILMTSYP